ncbi:MAG TPA: NAD-dependent epimerase/dehydratase family protein [Actinomycetota bacterium]
MSDRPGTVLVTGAAGFVGSHLSDRLLAQGYRVIGIDDLSVGRIANLAEARGYGKDFQFYNLDIRGEAIPAVFEKHQPELVMHLAAQSGVRPSLEDPRKDADINVLGTLNLLEAAARAGTRKIVYAASGGTIYGEPRRLPAKETATSGSHPQSPYGISKRVVHDYLLYFQRYEGLDFTSLALANVYGPRQDPHGEAGVVAIFGRRMLAGERPQINGDGNQTRDYVYVEDVVDAFARAVDAGSGKLINIGTGLETSVNHLFRLLAELTGYAGEPSFGPLPKGDLRRSSLDPSLAERDLGWKPWTQLEEGLRQTVEWLKAG